MPIRHYDETLRDTLRSEEDIALYLDEIMRENDPALFLDALRDVTKARGGMSAMSRSTGLARENLYNTLSENGNPTIDTLKKVLTQLGLRLSVSTIDDDRHQTATR